jgi:hypothetical protein
MLIFLALIVFPFLQASANNLTDPFSSRTPKAASDSNEIQGLSEVEISLASVTELQRALMALHLCELLLSQAAQKVLVGSVLRLEELQLEQYNKELEQEVTKRAADVSSIKTRYDEALKAAGNFLTR